MRTTKIGPDLRLLQLNCNYNVVVLSSLRSIIPPFTSSSFYITNTLWEVNPLLHVSVARSGEGRKNIEKNGSHQTTAHFQPE